MYQHISPLTIKKQAPLGFGGKFAEEFVPPTGENMPRYEALRRSALRILSGRFSMPNAGEPHSRGVHRRDMPNLSQRYLGFVRQPSKDAFKLIKRIRKCCFIGA
jgi:hypothetical protein